MGEVGDRQAGVADEPVDGAGQVASPGDALLEPVEAVLPAGGAGVRGEAVLEEEELPTGPQDPADLAQRAVDVGDRAEREGADDGVRAVVGQVEVG